MKTPQPAPAPAPPEPVRIPSPTDPDVMEARRRKMQVEFAGRRGRESTDLTGSSGSPSYSRTTLG
jgi:hypothetical protein